MFNSETVRKAEILKANLALEEFIDDLPLEEAASAFNNLSFHPERRGLECQLDYARRLCGQKDLVLKRIESAQQKGAIVAEDWELQFNSWFELFRNRVKAAFKSYLSTMSGCASSMITGPANFPVERMRKRSRIADDKYAQINEYTERAPERFLRKIMPFGDGTIISSNAPNASALLVTEIARMEKVHAQMIGANKIVRKTFKGDTAEGVSDEAKQNCALALANYLNVTLEDALLILQPSECEYSLKKIIAFHPYQLSNHNKEISRLKQRLVEVKQLHDKSTSIAQILNNGIEIKLSDDGKIEIHFGYKPDDTIRKFLTKNSFKYSRYRNNAWVRKMTFNAQAAFERVVKPELEKLQKM
ncbi:hypothetical protein [Photorhabdus bodei]|uniref:Uncharacterized protein n=1 Tax=Photorhabdus bodei TaxID=2029681 RepID=A0AAW6BQI8_9GAMM|nr:hypothetical protein [Photorhabdus bodei]MDB6375016.1 hypothetical protein [Photorhabdus bodei]